MQGVTPNALAPCQSTLAPDAGIVTTATMQRRERFAPTVQRSGERHLNALPKRPMSQSDARPPRKAIPKSVKIAVWTRQNGRCAHCQHKMESMAGADCQFDHRPPLRLREVNAARTDYVPPQNDPDYLWAVHVPCHLERTTGRRRDAERTVTTVGSDAWAMKRERQRTRPKKFRKPIPSRPFPEGHRPLRSRPWPKKPSS